MLKSDSKQSQATFDLSALDAELRKEDSYQTIGHMARTLVRTRDLRVVMIAARAGSRLAEHQANETVAIHVVSGAFRLNLPTGGVELRSGQLLALEPGLRHDVETVEEGALVLTLGWSGD